MMLGSTPQEAFNRVYNGHKNFMTPTVERYETTSKYYIEVSSGDDFVGVKMFGVTVITKDLKKCEDLSECCHSLEEVQNHINSLK